MSNVFIEMTFDNIYSFATCKLRFQSNSHFSIQFPEKLKVTAIENGIIKKPGLIQSVLDKNIELIKVTMLGVIEEIPITCGDGTSNVESYGMQYFPFLSSLIKPQFKVYNTKIGALSIVLPDKFRIIWFRQKLAVNKKTFHMTHSQGEKESVYVFTPKAEVADISENTGKSEIVDEINGNIPVRLGGKEYLRIVTFPSMYFGMSLIAISLLALQDKSNLTFGAVAAAWVLMLRHFNAANSPQLNTVLRDIYFILGGALLLWAISWEKFEVKALFCGCFVFILYWGLRRINAKFSREGVLPAVVEKFLYKLRKKHENKNKC